MSRHEFTKATQRDASERCKGKCECCGIKLPRGGFHYDHINPDWFSGSNALDNCQVLCLKCHRTKTSERDIPAIAKTKRILDKDRGIKSRSSFQTNRDGPYKKRMDGTVIRRGA